MEECEWVSQQFSATSKLDFSCCQSNDLINKVELGDTLYTTVYNGQAHMTYGDPETKVHMVNSSYYIICSVLWCLQNKGCLVYTT